MMALQTIRLDPMEFRTCKDRYMPRQLRAICCPPNKSLKYNMLPCEAGRCRKMMYGLVLGNTLLTRVCRDLVQMLMVVKNTMCVWWRVHYRYS